MSDLRAKHEALMMADVRMAEAQTALDAATREHWMASQAQDRALQDYYEVVKGLKKRVDADACRKQELEPTEEARRIDRANRGKT